MPDWMLDSVAVIDHYGNRPGVAPYWDQILGGESTGAFSTITELELWQGIRPGEQERHDAILALLELNRIEWRDGEPMVTLLNDVSHVE